MTKKSCLTQLNGFRGLSFLIAFLLLSNAGLAQFFTIPGNGYTFQPVIPLGPDISLVDINASYEVNMANNQVILTLRPILKTDNDIEMGACEVRVSNPHRIDVGYYNHEPIQYSAITSRGSLPSQQESITMIFFLPLEDRVGRFELHVSGVDANGWQREYTLEFTLPINQIPAGMSLSGKDGLVFMSNPNHTEVAVFEDNHFYRSTLGFSNRSTVLIFRANWDGDGREDYLFRDGSNFIFACWKENARGALNLESRIVQNIGWTARLLGKGDFNGDGLTDLLYYDYLRGEIVQWYVDIDAQNINSRSTKISWTRPANYEFIGIADFDGNGKSDIFWQDTQTNELVVWDERFYETRHGLYDSEIYEFMHLADSNHDQKFELFYMVRDSQSFYKVEYNSLTGSAEHVRLGNYNGNLGQIEGVVGFGSFYPGFHSIVLRVAYLGQSYYHIATLDGSRIIPIGSSSGYIRYEYNNPIRIGDFDGDGLAEIFKFDTAPNGVVTPTIYGIDEENMWRMTTQEINSDELIRMHLQWDLM